MYSIKLLNKYNNNVEYFISKENTSLMNASFLSNFGTNNFKSVEKSQASTFNDFSICKLVAEAISIRLSNNEREKYYVEIFDV